MTPRNRHPNQLLPAPSCHRLRFDGLFGLFDYLLQLCFCFLSLCLCLGLGGFYTALPQEDTGGLGGAGEEEEEVDRGKEDVLGPDDEAPPSPDKASHHESGVCIERELRGGTREVRGTGDDDTPFHDGSPVVLC